jgi:hypothetical protein
LFLLQLRLIKGYISQTLRVRLQRERVVRSLLKFIIVLWLLLNSDKGKANPFPSFLGAANAVITRPYESCTI